MSCDADVLYVMPSVHIARSPKRHDRLTRESPFTSSYSNVTLPGSTLGVVALPSVHLRWFGASAGETTIAGCILPLTTLRPFFSLILNVSSLTKYSTYNCRNRHECFHYESRLTVSPC